MSKREAIVWLAVRPVVGLAWIVILVLTLALDSSRDSVPALPPLLGALTLMFLAAAIGWRVRSRIARRALAKAGRLAIDPLVPVAAPEGASPATPAQVERRVAQRVGSVVIVLAGSAIASAMVFLFGVVDPSVRVLFGVLALVLLLVTAAVIAAWRIGIRRRRTLPPAEGMS